MTRFKKCKGDFNPRSPCGERRHKPDADSLHNGFQSTLPVRGATKDAPIETITGDISIHAPRAGSDPLISTLSASLLYFNPRSPCGERLYNYHADKVFILFQSTLPVRGATTSRKHQNIFIKISIHAPRAGSDSKTSRKHQNTFISIHAPRAGSDY